MFHPIAGWYSDRLPRTSKRSYILSGRSINRLHRLPNGFWSRSKLHFRQFFSENEKRRLSGEYISQKPPEIVGVGSSSPPGKEKYLFVCTPQLGHEKPRNRSGIGVFDAISFLVAQHGTLHQKRYFTFFVSGDDFPFIWAVQTVNKTSWRFPRIQNLPKAEALP